MKHAPMDRQHSPDVWQEHVQDKLLTPEQIATVLGLSPKTLARWRWAGCGPRFIKIGGRVRYAENDVQTFITAGVRLSTSDNGSASSGT